MCNCLLVGGSVSPVTRRFRVKKKKSIKSPKVFPPPKNHKHGGCKHPHLQHRRLEGRELLPNSRIKNRAPNKTTSFTQHVIFHKTVMMIRRAIFPITPIEKILLQHLHNVTAFAFHMVRVVNLCFPKPEGQAIHH